MQRGKLHYRDIVLIGVRVRFESDDPLLPARVAAAYAPWICNAAIAGMPSVYVVIESGDPPGHRRHRADGTTLAVAVNNAWLEADGAIGRGRAVLPGDVEDSALVETLNTIVLFLAAHQGRIPLHASAIMLGDAAIVLAGPSGTGKSTLALAASRNGLAVLSDDTIFVQTEPRFRLWSLARAIHVFAADAPNEPGSGTRLRAGRLKKVVPIISPRQTAERAILCVLERGERVALTAMDRGQAVARLTDHPEPGYEFYGARAVAAANALAAGGAWRLTLSSDPAEAIALLRHRFARATADLAGAP